MIFHLQGLALVLEVWAEVALFLVALFWLFGKVDHWFEQALDRAFGPFDDPEPVTVVDPVEWGLEQAYSHLPAHVPDHERPTVSEWLEDRRIDQ